jgi:hypothetical protein
MQYASGQAPEGAGLTVGHSDYRGNDTFRAYRISSDKLSRMASAECLEVARRLNAAMQERVKAGDDLAAPTDLSIPVSVRSERFEKAKVEWWTAKDDFFEHLGVCRECGYRR